MKTVKEHYDNHLGDFYSWMLGDFEVRSKEQQEYFLRNHIHAPSASTALDLGCGNGIQSVALARLGFSVKAIDFNQQLLHELRNAKHDLDIEIIQSDILELDFNRFRPDLIVCMGDTLTHFPDKKIVERLVELSSHVLQEGGKLVFSFRDLHLELNEEHRFFCVKSDENRIHTCFLEYFGDHVVVHDILHERKEGWTMKVSAYPKLKLSADELKLMLRESEMKIIGEEVTNGMIHMIAIKESDRSQLADS